MGETRLADLSDENGFEALLSASSDRPQLIFKHSLTCSLSSRAYGELLRYLEGDDLGVDHWLVRIQRHRTVSDLVEKRLGIRHESPQAILVRDRRAVWNASHFAITAEALRERARTIDVK